MSNLLKKILEIVLSFLFLTPLFLILFIITVFCLVAGFSAIDFAYNDEWASIGRRFTAVSGGLMLLGVGLIPVGYYLFNKFRSSSIFISMARITVAFFCMICGTLFSLGLIADFTMPSGNIGHGFYSRGMAVFRLLFYIILIILGFMGALISIYWAISGYKDTFDCSPKDTT